MPGSSRAVSGVALACVTAAVSGVSVFLNSYGVHAISSPSVYTTAKNLVATACLAGFAAFGRSAHGTGAPRRFVTSPRAPRTRGPLRWLGLAYVGIVGGGLAFVLFFDGLANTSASPAALWHDTLIVWVSLLAVSVLHERIRWWNLVAVALLLAGQVILAGGPGQLAADRGGLLILSATMLWSTEVVVTKLLLRDTSPALVALVRMGVGSATLLVYLGTSGALPGLAALGAHQVAWVLLTGLLLAVYVGTWMSALARARALDVTSVLVGSALVTWLLQLAAGTAMPVPDALGLLPIAAGIGLVVWMVLGHRTLRRTRAGVR